MWQMRAIRLWVHVILLLAGGLSSCNLIDAFSMVVSRTRPVAAAATRTHAAAKSSDEADGVISNDDSSRSTTTGDDSTDDQIPYPQLNIAFVTGNEMKARELNMILKEHGATRGPTNETSMVNLRIVTVDLPEIQEVNTEGIAREKAMLGAQLAGGPCVVEDTSLQFHALGGMPGPFIKFFQDTLGSEGLYNILHAYQDKSATAVCTLAFCPYPHADPVLFTGTTRGTIVEPQSGRGFGWDGIFVPEDRDVPFSCMTTAEKNALSHRGKAVRQWADWLGRNRQELWERQGGRSAIGHKGLDFKSTSAEQ